MMKRMLILLTSLCVGSIVAMDPNGQQQKMEKDLGFNGKTHKPGLFNSSVQLFYSATGNFAHIAKNVGDEPTPDDYEKVIAALREITSICSGCHSDFRLK